MALLSPSQIHAVLKQEEAAKTPAAPNQTELARLLEKHQLTADDALENLGSTMRCGENAATRLRATETALQLNGLMAKDNQKPDFNVIINIMDSEFSGLNPILVPR